MTDASLSIKETLTAYQAGADLLVSSILGAVRPDHSSQVIMICIMRDSNDKIINAASIGCCDAHVAEAISHVYLMEKLGMAESPSNESN